MIKRLTQAFSNETADESVERRPIDDLTGDETRHALDYLALLDRETTTENIEWAAYQLQAEDIDLATPMETLKERGEHDKRLIAPRVVQDYPKFQVRDDRISQIRTVTSFPRKLGLVWLVTLTLADVDLLRRGRPRLLDGRIVGPTGRVDPDALAELESIHRLPVHPFAFRLRPLRPNDRGLIQADPSDPSVRARVRDLVAGLRHRPP